MWQQIVQSIKTVGLKRPITVAHADGETEGIRYNLVSGQGRMEAFLALGETTIPAVIVDASNEERQLMSLVENIARRPPSTRAILFEVRALRERGYKSDEIAAKLGLDRPYISGILHLLDKGEELLIESVEAGRIPLTIAIEIAAGNDAGVSKALSEAYEKGDLRGNKVRAARRVILQRIAKQRRTGKLQQSRRQLTGEALVREYKEKVREQRKLIAKAERTKESLLLFSSAMRTLFADENFRTLLRAEGLHTVPTELASRLQ
jgi:ParB family chromosome partitioning protein